jgi:metallo-beta-lactamase family protein
MKIKFCGAAKEVTGSAHLFKLDNGFTFLLDCGLYQGREESMKDFNKTWLFDPAEVDCVVLSHGHIDHIGRLPKLRLDGFSGPVYSTPATHDVSAILLLDSALIQVRDAEYDNKKLRAKGHLTDENKVEPLYTPDDVPATMKQFVSYSYDTWFNIHPDVSVQYKDAGHILGSASINLKIKENGKVKLFAFSGDIGRPNRPILKDPMPMDQAEYILSESTYGDRDHEASPGESDKLLEIITSTCIDKKGKVIIPAFSLGRTQEIVYILDHLYNAGKLPKVPIYVDSPLSVNATAVYSAHPECYDRELFQYMIQHKDPFGFNGLIYITEVEESKSLNYNDDPCVIISSSGMVTAGRIQHHILNNCENSNNTILIIGYCAPGTPGRLIMDGADHIIMHGQERAINARVEVMQSFSAHGDRHEMKDFLSNQKSSATRIYLVHGEEKAQIAFREFLQADGFGDIYIPSLGEEIEIKF